MRVRPSLQSQGLLILILLTIVVIAQTSHAPLAGVVVLDVIMVVLCLIAASRYRRAAASADDDPDDDWGRFRTVCLVLDALIGFFVGLGAVLGLMNTANLFETVMRIVQLLGGLGLIAYGIAAWRTPLPSSTPGTRPEPED